MTRMLVPSRPLDEREESLLKELLEVWKSNLDKNQVRRKYYDSKNKLKDLGIALPPSLERKIQVAVGWPAKAVDSLAERSRFDGFALDDDVLQREVFNIFDDNNFRLKYPQLTTNQLIHTCSFLVVSRGGRGEPDILISGYSAENAAARWCYRTNRILDGITLPEIDDGKPAAINLYLQNQIVEIVVDGRDYVVARRHFHRYGVPLMVALPYQPSLDRPFGRARISRVVMSLTDSAVRTAMRSEVGAEFYTYPQRYLLGITDKATRDEFKAWIGGYLALGTNEEGENPSIGQLAPAGIEGHISQMRSLATQFSGETGVPVSSLGVISDNPSSAEAIHAAREDLILKAEDLNEINGQALRSLGLMVLALRYNTPIARLSSAHRSITPRFKNPALPSPAARADALLKLTQAFPWLSQSNVALEFAGFSESDIKRMANDREEAGIEDILRRISQMPDEGALSGGDAHSSDAL